MGKSYWMVEQNGNFTNDKNDTFDPKKRYIGVRLQQGVPLLDRNWNELEDIRRYEEMITRREYIGNGSPDDGFKISACDPPANDFLIGTGRCMVDGFDIANENSLHYKDQSLKPLVPPTDKDRLDTVYLHVWINEVRSPATPEETDPEKFDSSLGNKDDVKVETSVRHKLVWRVEVDEGSKGEYKSPTIKFVDYKYTDGNWSKYPVIDSIEGILVPLEPADASKSAQLVLDSNEDHTLKTDDKLDLGKGYSLHVKQVDVDGQKVWLEFYKGEESVEDQIISTDSGDHTWNCTLDIQGTKSVVVLKVHVKQVFQSAVDGIVKIDGLWLIDYANVVKIETSDELGYHHYYDIARITRKKEQSDIRNENIEDLREGRGKDKLTISKLNVDPCGSGGIVIGNPNTKSGGHTSLTIQISDKENGYSLLQSIKESGSRYGDISLNPIDGNVGIGKVNPSEKLDVHGNICLTGQIIQDEWIEEGFNATDWKYSSRDYNPPSYFRDKNGIVHLRGAVKPINLAKDSFIFKLYEGYIPEKKELHLIPSLSEKEYSLSYCEISSEGVKCVNEVKSNFTLFLDGITFRAKT